MFVGVFTRCRARPLAAAVAGVSIALGAAVTCVIVGLYGEFAGGVYGSKVDVLARSFSITKAQPHGIKTTGIESLHDSDVDALRQELDPSVVEHVIPIAQGRAVLRRGSRGFSGGVIGGSADYLSYMGTPLLRGAMFDSAQVTGTARVILLGPGVVKALFPDDPEAAVGSVVRVGRLPFTVIGLIGKDATGGNASVSIAPVTTVRSDLLGGIRTVGAIGVVARGPSAVTEAGEQATDILQRQHGALKTGRQIDFSITTFASDRLSLARPLIEGAFWFATGVVVLCFLLGVLATGGLHAGARRRARVTGTGSGEARLFAGSVRDALVCTAGGIALGVLAGHRLTAVLTGVAPQTEAPRLVTPVTVAAGLVYGLTVGLVGGALGAAGRRRAGPARGAGT